MQSSAMGSSSFLHSPFLPSSPCFSSSSLSSRPLLLSLRNAGPKRRIRAPIMASVQPKSPPESCSAQRRVLIFLGVSVLPFLKWNHADSVGLAAAEDAERTQAGPDKQALQRSPPPNPFLTLINAIGTLGSGILGALYAIARKDKIALEEKIESLTNEVTVKDATIVSMEKNFESKLLQQKEEENKKLSQAKEEQFSLTNRLYSANTTISGIERMLQDEKAKIKELEIQIDSLCSRLSKTEKDKTSLDEKLKEKNESISSLQDRLSLLSSEIKYKEEAIQSMSSSLAGKDVDLKNLGAEYDKVRGELARLKADNTDLKEEILKFKDELSQNNVTVNELNTSLSSLVVERDELRTSYDATLKEYDELKKRAAFEAKLLEEKEVENSNLKEKYELAMAQASKYEALISDLTQDRAELKKSLERTQEALKTSRNEALEFANQLTSLKSSNSKLESELSQVLTEFAQARESEKLKYNALVTELSSVKSVLEQTKSELDGTKEELKASVGDRESLQKELIEKYELAAAQASKYEALISDLTRDRDDLKKSVNSLKEELERRQEALETSRNEASEFANQLTFLRSSNSSLESELSQVRTEFTQARESETIKYNALVTELNSVRSVLERTKEELKASVGDRESLQKELIEVYEKAEAATRSLQEDKESRKVLENDLDEATVALDEMNRKTVLLSKELEMARAHVGSLEGEKAAFNEARENLEDAQEVIKRLGGERESMERKVKGLEKQLASSKSEILKLKAMVNPPPPPRAEPVVDDELEVGPAPVASAKRVGRRKKVE